MKKVIALIAVMVCSTSIYAKANCAQLVMNSVNNAMPGFHAVVTPFAVQNACNPCKTDTKYTIAFERDCNPCAPVCNPCAPVCDPCAPVCGPVCDPFSG